MKSCTHWILGLTAAIALFSLLATPAPVAACMGATCCTGCSECGGGTICCEECFPCAGLVSGDEAQPVGKTVVSFPEPGTALVNLYGYDTKSLQPEQECVVALAPVEGVAKVEAITNVDSRTQLPFAAVDFSPSAIASLAVPAVATDAGVQMPTGEWYGFQSTITGSVADGVPNHFVVEVTLEEGVSPQQFVETLRRDGVFLTGSSKDGIPDDGHVFFRRLADSQFIVHYPEGDTTGPRRRPLQRGF